MRPEFPIYFIFAEGGHPLRRWYQPEQFTGKCILNIFRLTFEEYVLNPIFTNFWDISISNEFIHTWLDLNEF